MTRYCPRHIESIVAAPGSPYCHSCRRDLGLAMLVVRMAKDKAGERICVVRELGADALAIQVTP